VAIRINSAKADRMARKLAAVREANLTSAVINAPRDRLERQHACEQSTRQRQRTRAPTTSTGQPNRSARGASVKARVLTDGEPTRT
jgi:hypothetical protein